MTKIVKINEIFYPGIDTNYDELNIANEFSYEIKRAHDNVVIQNEITDAVFEEVIMGFEEHSAEVLADANAGRKTFTVKKSNLAVGDSIGINDDYYVIDKISTDGVTITIKSKLKNTIYAGDSITTCGNTGTYKIPVMISAAGFYFITFFHKKFGHASVKYKVTNTNVSDIMTELINIKDKLEQKNIGFV